MKKIAFLSLALAVIMVLSACAGEPEATDTTAAGTEPVSVTSEITEAETKAAVTETEKQPEEKTTGAVTEESAPQHTVADFFKTHAGYWTEKENGEFIRFYGQDGEYRVSFEMWEAGGPFPSGKINEAEKTGDGAYTLKITVSEQPDDPESYGEGWASYDYTMQVTDKDADPASIEAAAPGKELKTYYFHTEAENPFIKSGEEAKEEFIRSHEGFFSKENGLYFSVEAENGGRVTFAVWSAGGPFPSGNISNVVCNGNGSYTVTVEIEAVEANDENDGWEASTYVFTVTDRDTEPKSVLAQHIFDDSEQIFRYHTTPGYPFKIE